MPTNQSKTTPGGASPELGRGVGCSAAAAPPSTGGAAATIQAAAVAASFGLDWPNATHSINLQGTAFLRREHAALEHRPKRIDDWARNLRQPLKGKPVAFAIELDTSPSGALHDPTDVEPAPHFELDQTAS